jgi:hypothetical protein
VSSTEETPPVDTIEGWRGQRISGKRSRGSREFWAHDWRELVLETNGAIEDKAREPAGSAVRWFEADDHACLARLDGRCCYLQSLKSEDTVTWTAFGSAVPDAALMAVLDRAFGSVQRPTEWTRAFWKRWPHPDTGLTQHGPEPDLVLRSAEWTYVIEAKWLADLDDHQGREGKTGQMALRAAIARSESAASETRGVLVVVPGPSLYPSARRGTFAKYFAVHGDGYLPLPAASDLGARAVTWEQVVQAIEPYCSGSEVVQYLRWRLALLSPRKRLQE